VIFLLYNGWNPIASDKTNSLVRAYMWGLDASGSMQGAGGVARTADGECRKQWKCKFY